MISTGSPFVTLAGTSGNQTADPTKYLQLMSMCYQTWAFFQTVNIISDLLKITPLLKNGIRQSTNQINHSDHL